MFCVVEPKDLGRGIRNLRIESGIGLRQLSRMADISPASLTAIEKGRHSGFVELIEVTQSQ